MQPQGRASQNRTKQYKEENPSARWLKLVIQLCLSAVDMAGML